MEIEPRAQDGSSASSVLTWLDTVEVQRRSAGLRRQLRARVAEVSLIDLASNDYLGLVKDPRVIDGAISALRTWGAGSTGSRLVTGTTSLHEIFEAELATFVGTQAGLIFSSGYMANLAAVTALSGPGSLIVSDAGSHASLVDACRLSRARVHVAQHLDIHEIAEVLSSRAQERAVVITDSVFSADGDVADLVALHTVCRNLGALLIVDEAHALGVRGPGGRGLVNELGLAGEPDIVITATLSKSLAGQGGVVLCADKVRDHLIDTARTFIFDTGLAPASVGAAQAALGVLREEPGRAQAVLDRAADLAKIVWVDEKPESAVVSVILGDAQRAVTAARECYERGVHVGCFRPPSVPVGTSRLRLTARASLTQSELKVVSSVLAEVLAR